MISIVWFKRDFRWHDHAPWAAALRSGNPIVLLYVIEPSLLRLPEYSDRHWWFQYNAFREIQQSLKQLGVVVNAVQSEVVPFLDELRQEFGTIELFSHEETGQLLTFQRDIAVKKWCKQNNCNWSEFQQFGVRRGRKNRDNWAEEWDKFMAEPIVNVPVEKGRYLRLSETFRKKYPVTFAPQVQPDMFQIPGRNAGLALLQSFVQNRSVNYSRHISKPLLSRESCSRLSPHIAWGTVSLREVVQAIDKAKLKGNKRNLENYKSRLYWHCHFIQKLESEPAVEWANQNPAFNAIRSELNEDFFEKWSTGTTGFPLVDACMRCVVATGFINFRMRAMVVSFWTHHLFQPWKPAATFLARQFLDYEPGIHFSQFQMQAGTVGYHTVRTYNPVKQAEDHDTDAQFIQQWIPELRNLPAHFARQPWTMTQMEQLFLDFEYGVQYPERMIDMESTGKYARDTIHALKNASLTKVYANQIRKVHVNQRISSKKNR